MSRRQVVLYYAHVVTPSAQREVDSLRAQLDGCYDIVVVGYCRSGDDLAAIQGVPSYAYTADDLATLPYGAKLERFDPDDYIGNADLVPLRFFRDRPHYDHYWIVECDVRFGGNWSDLFEELSTSDADLLSTTVQTYADNPGWAHWHTLASGGDEVPIERRVKGFIPFGRISRGLLALCDARYREGWSGHSEVLWPTIASEAGLRVEDIGGNSRFTPAARRGRLYINTPGDWSLFPGTFVYRPCFADRDLSGPTSRFPGWLWHPVKGA